MAISISFAGANIRKPGAFSKTEVRLTGGFPLSPTGIVAILGEAEGGEPGSSAGVQTFTSEDIASLASIYKSGPLVDAARILIAPARDARVPNGTSIIRVWKTNQSTKSSKILKNGAGDDLFTVSSANFGEDENLISVKVDAGSNPDARIVTVSKSGTTETLSENPRDVMLTVEYTGAGSAATLTITGGTLATTVTGGPGGEDLSISLSGKTIKDLADLIDANSAYSASTAFVNASFTSASDLDPITTPADIKSSPLPLYREQKELLDIINGESSLITATRFSDVESQIAVSAKSFLTGASKGASANSDFQEGFDALLSIRCNTVVPLVSRDASDLVSEGETDPASTFTADAINLQATTHCITASNTKNKSERNCYVSVKRSFALSQGAAKELNSERASMMFQDVEVLGSDGNLKFVDPWGASCILAGIQAGTDPGTPATFKIVNANGIRHEDYNDRTQVELAIDAGLLPLESLDSGGFRVVVHNTTYGRDSSFVFNRAHVIEAADTVAFNLRQQLEAIFVGNKVVTGTAETIKNTVVSIMDSFLKAELITGDDTNGQLGFKDLIVTINGSRATVDVTITPVQGIDFILNTITLDNIRQTA